jgi:hypothetical protein
MRGFRIELIRAFISFVDIKIRKIRQEEFGEFHLYYKLLGKPTLSCLYTYDKPILENKCYKTFYSCNLPFTVVIWWVREWRERNILV